MELARSVGCVFDVNHNITTVWRWARGAKKAKQKEKKQRKLSTPLNPSLTRPGLIQTRCTTQAAIDERVFVASAVACIREVNLLNFDIPSTQLRSSSDSRLLRIPSFRLKSFGRRKFSYIRPLSYGTFSRTYSVIPTLHLPSNLLWRRIFPLPNSLLFLTFF